MRQSGARPLVLGWERERRRARLLRRGGGLIVVRQLAASLDWFLREGVGKTVRARLNAPKG